MLGKALYYGLLAGVCAGFAVGAVTAALELAAQAYLDQGLYRLALDVVLEHLKFALVPSAAAGLAVGVALCCVGRARNWHPVLGAVAALGLAGSTSLLVGWLRGDLPAELHLFIVGALGAALFTGSSLARQARGFRRLGATASGTCAVVVALLAALHLPGLLKAPPAGASRPSVLLIVVDTLRADHVGSYGYARDTTPHLDRFAREALLFRHAHSVAPWTTPSVAAMFTSRYPSEVSWRHPPVALEKRQLSLPELLKDRGYATAAVVSHLYVGRELGFGQGFDVYDQENARGHRHVSGTSVTDKALALLEQRRDEPFFLFVHYFDVHFDYLLHPRFNFDPDYSGSLRPGTTYSELRRLAPQMSAADLDYVRALYDSEIRFTDEQIGRLLRGLRDLSLWDQTLVIVTADHREEFSERGSHYIGHGTHVHQELVHVPLLIKPPGHAPRGTVDAWVSLLDLAPTVAEVAGGQPAVAAFRGAPLDLETGGGGSEPVIAESGNKRAVFKDGWKLMSSGDPPVYRLFQLSSDPGEKHDVLALYPERAGRLRRALEEWVAATPRGRGAASAVFTAAERDQLRALGYLD